jgi:PilZ domain
MQNALKPEERRQSTRYPLERLAMIKAGNDTPPRYCLVIDVSEGGVRLDVHGFELPDEFVLLFSGDSPARDGTYRVVWRFEQKVGAKLISAV